jgi:hypothetical protein
MNPIAVAFLFALVAGVIALIRFSEHSRRMGEIAAEGRQAERDLETQKQINENSRAAEATRDEISRSDFGDAVDRL